LLILLRKYGIKLINGAPRSPQTQGLVEKGNDEVEKKITKWKLDHGTNKWHYSLVEVALQINSQYHRTIGGHSFEVVFRHKKPINWLTHEERKVASGVECEGGEIISEESLSKELEDEKKQEVLDNLRDLEILGVKVPAKPAMGSSAKSSTPLTNDQNTPAQTTEDISEEVLAASKPATSLPTPEKSHKPLVLSPRRNARLIKEPDHVTAPSSFIDPLLRDKQMGDGQSDKEEPEKVTILAKEPETQPESYPARRPITDAELVESGLKFHGKDIPLAHTLLIFRGKKSGEMKPIVGGQLDYKDPLEGYINLAQVDNGMLFHWPTFLVSREELPKDFDIDLRAPFEASDKEMESDNDPVLKRVRKKTLKARDQMVMQYSKSHEIDVFAVRDIVTLRLPGGSGGVRTSTDSRRLFCSIRSVPHEHRYELQTKFGVLDRLVPTRELKRVPRLLADSQEIEALVNGPSKKVSMKKIGEKASTSDRVLISCRCKGKCASRRCRCFKEGKRCSVHCHVDAEHDCGFLASLANRTEVALKEKEKGDFIKGKKMARADKEEETITVET
jgi:hypothetical protein